MHNPESVRENETHKILWDFEIQTDSPNLGQTTGPIERKKMWTCWIVDFTVPANHKVKLKENEHESDGDTTCNWCAWFSH